MKAIFSIINLSTRDIVKIELDVLEYNFKEERHFVFDMSNLTEIDKKIFYEALNSENDEISIQLFTVGDEADPYLGEFYVFSISGDKLLADEMFDGAA